MLKNILFDFGDVFINLDKEVVFEEIKNYGGNHESTLELLALSEHYEVGKISSKYFVNQLLILFPKLTATKIEQIWNSMLLDFPMYRLEFLEKLAAENNYRLFLLSNTNALHINHIIKTMGSEKYHRFKNCFEKFYLSHEIKLRKPNTEIYTFVLNENGLKAQETFFIDDTKANTDAAKKLGIVCWHLQVANEDVIQLKEKL